MSDALRVVAVLSLVGANAFFVIGEYAVVTARRSALAPRARAGSARAGAALRLMDDPVRVISTVQVGITAIGILTGAIGEPLVRDLLGGGLPTWASFLVAFALVTYFTVVLGELVPKALTLDRAEKLVIAVARPIALIARVLRPLVWTLEASAEIVLRPFGIREVVTGESVQTAQELRALVDEAEESGVIPRAQEEMLHNVFRFATREARDVMTPAPDVAWLEAGGSVAEALERVVERPHSRYPVGRETLDNVVGTVHVRELVAAAQEDPDRPVGSASGPALVVPQTKDLGTLLRELREKRLLLAVVVDEYGGTAGVVTLEDIVEEIVGDIADEYDRPDDTPRWVDEDVVEIAGSMAVDDFNEEVGTHLVHDRVRTMAGLALAALGRRPDPGDEIDVGSVRLRVEDMRGARITRLRVELDGGGAGGDG